MAPNTADAYDALRVHLEPFLARLYPEREVEVAHIVEAASRLTIGIRTADTPGVEALLDRLHRSYA